MKRWILFDNVQAHREEVVDQEHDLILFFVASSGFGTPSANLKIAQKVVDYLNSLPPEETLMYPHNK